MAAITMRAVSVAPDPTIAITTATGLVWTGFVISVGAMSGLRVRGDFDYVANECWIAPLVDTYLRDMTH